MRLFSRIWVVAAVILAAAAWADAAGGKAPGGCGACHDDFKAVLGASHPDVKAKSIAQCLACHGKPGKAKADGAFSARLHRAHAGAQGVDCLVCHDFAPGRKFSVKGSPASLGKPKAADLTLCKELMDAQGPVKFMAAGHQEKRVACSGCHGAGFPLKGDSVENDRCLSCHGTYEALAGKSKAKDPTGLNPHKSHYGAVACTACHMGHQKSVVYCKDCHPKSTLVVPFEK